MASTGQRVAIVTGANQGIGFELVRQLCKTFDGYTLLAARNQERGEAAVKWLKDEEGLHPEFLPLDVDSEESIRAAKEIVEKKYGRLDVLVNNAGVLFRMDSGLSFQGKAEQTIKTNYFGVLHVTNIFAPLLQPNSRIVNLSSGMGRITYVSKERREEILSPELTEEKLSAIMEQFVQDSHSTDYASKGWPLMDSDFCTYNVSKIGLNRLTELQAAEFSSDPSRSGILVNSCSPGWVRTQMGTYAATRTTDQGAETPLYLALLPPGTTEPNGEYIYDKVVAKWKS